MEDEQKEQEKPRTYSKEDYEAMGQTLRQMALDFISGNIEREHCTIYL